MAVFLLFNVKPKKADSPTAESECSNASFQTLSMNSELYVLSRADRYLARGWLPVQMEDKSLLNQNSAVEA